MVYYLGKHFHKVLYPSFLYSVHPLICSPIICCSVISEMRNGRYIAILGTEQENLTPSMQHVAGLSGAHQGFSFITFSKFSLRSSLLQQRKKCRKLRGIVWSATSFQLKQHTLLSRSYEKPHSLSLKRLISKLLILLGSLVCFSEALKHIFLEASIACVHKLSIQGKQWQHES